MALTTILNNNTAGGIFTSQPPFSISVSQQAIMNALNPLLVQTELSQPEGTPLQLQIANLSNASTIAQRLNQQFQSGQLRDAATGDPLQAWPGHSVVAQAQGSTLYLRWVKGQPFLPVLVWGIIIIAAAIAVFLIVRQLMQNPWSLGKSLLPKSTGSSSRSGPPLGIPWWEWIAGGTIIFVGGPFVIREVDRWVVAEGQLRQARKRYG